MGALSREPLALPAELAAQGVSLRPETAEDHAFLEFLYCSVRWPELIQTDWSDEAKLHFLKDQYRLQVIHYTRYYAEAAFSIVEWQGQPAGRLYLHRSPEELRIVDISLLPDACGRGLGGALLHAVFAEARAAGQYVCIHVELFNPARRLYDRLGFLPVGEPDGPYQRMEWRP
jgi:GNAT superfamily N-acetyltransferase